MKKIELLAPAGSKQSFIAAINAGANAIYLGGKLFSARAFANNFSNEELENMIIYAHKRNVKVYVTVNTIIFQEEFDQVISFIEFLHTRNVDAILIQDLGLASYLHEVYPNLVLHASTQLNCHNVEEAKALINLGFKRIVLARETPIEIAKQIKDLGVEVEVFVHGALCVSYSGQCLMSSLIGNRSGNRGKCAQPCRNYMVCKNEEQSSNDFAISMRDLCTIDHIQEYVENGIDSLKIEGRMKREEYVYDIVSSYRQAIDSYFANKRIDYNEKVNDMAKLFNREFTKGFIFNESRTKTLNQRTSSHIGMHLGYVTGMNKNYAFIKLDDDIACNDGIRINNKKQEGQIVQKMFLNNMDVKEAKKGDTIKLLLYGTHPSIGDEIIKTTSSKQIEDIDANMSIEKRIPLGVNVIAYINSVLKMKLSFNEVEVIVESQYVVQESKNELSLDKLQNQVNRFGESDFELASFIFTGDSNAFIPNSVLNDLRREGIKQMEEKINSYFSVNTNIVKNQYGLHSSSCNKEFVLSCQIENEEQLKACLNYPFNKIFINDKKLYFKYKDDNRIYYSLPRIDEQDKIDANDNEVLPYIKPINKKNNVIASPYMYGVNSYALDYFFNNGINEVVLSYELSKNRIIAMMEDYKNRNGSYPYVGIPVYGYIDLMIMKSCPIASMHKMPKDHCNMCRRKHYVLQDRKDVSFEMMHDDRCFTRILNSLPLYLLDSIEEMKQMNISEGIIYFTNENEAKVNTICFDAFNKLDQKDKDIPFDKITRGHFNREIE